MRNARRSRVRDLRTLVDVAHHFFNHVAGDRDARGNVRDLRVRLVEAGQEALERPAA